MKVFAYKSERVMEKWPDAYWEEFSRKLVERGHEGFIATGDVPIEEVHRVLDDSDAYIGPVGEFYEYAGKKGVKRVALLGPSLVGEGVKSPIVCVGCLDKINPKPVDCFFQDEICLLEITPNDVLGALCA